MTRQADQQPSPSRSNAEHAIMFWVLMTISMAVFAPCVLLPIWYQTEQIVQQQHVFQSLVAEMEEQVARDVARMDAMQEDVELARRLARRELNYKSKDETVVAYSSDELAPFKPVLPEKPARFAPAPDPRPDWMIAAARWLPNWPWRKLFAESPSRQVLMAAAGGLLLAAFLLYGPKPLLRSSCPDEA